MNKNRMTLLVRIGILVLVMSMVLSIPMHAVADKSDDVENDKDAVLQLLCNIKDDQGVPRTIWSGSCFLISPDTVLTCYHCVDSEYAVYILKALLNEGVSVGNFDDLSKINQKLSQRISYEVTVSRDVKISATVVNGSQQMDFAILKLSQQIHNRTTLKIRQSKTVKGAEEVYALGYPSDSERGKIINTYDAKDVTFAKGVVSKAEGLYAFQYDNGTQVSGNFIQTDCRISNGNSGGPVVDTDGYVIGIAAAAGDYYYAVAIDQVTEILDALGIGYEKAGSAPVPPTAQPEPEPTKAPVSTAGPEPNPAPSNNNTLLFIIIGVVAAVIAAVVVVAILLTRKKPAKPAAAPAARPAAPQPGGYTASPFNTAAPVRPPVPNTPPMASGESGATTILRGQVNATTMLASNGGAIIRTKNNDRLDLRVQEVLIGRDPAVCNFHVTGNSNIGRKHAKFIVKNGTTYIVDLNSTNGTFVNGVKIQPNVEVALNNGDKILLADEEFRFTK